MTPAVPDLWLKFSAMRLVCSSRVEDCGKSLEGGLLTTESADTDDFDAATNELTSCSSWLIRSGRFVSVGATGSACTVFLSFGIVFAYEQELDSPTRTQVPQGCFRSHFNLLYHEPIGLKSIYMVKKDLLPSSA
jgi:hypothetical protein